MAQPLLPVVVTRRETSGPDCWTLYWKRGFEFLPGQVVAVSLESDGPQRLYSLATGNNDLEAGILFNLAPDGWLTPLLRQKNPGDVIYVSRPFGSFIGTPGPAVWIANGTGIAPFLSMVLSGLVEAKQMIHGARTRGNFFGGEIMSRALGGSYWRCASGDSGEGLIEGRLTSFLEKAELSKGPVYLCGSASMIVDSRDILIRRGFPFKDILSEVYF